MKAEKNILIAFILNLSFAIAELAGGLFTNSIAILSDAIHDLGDAISIGISYFLEKLSKKEPDKSHTYGYARYSVLGAAFTSIVLIVGSLLVIIRAIDRIIHPSEVSYNGMIAFAIVGIVVNFIAACFTKDGDSLNQKSVNLHMLEDVFGWVSVLVGAIVIKFKNWHIIDPIMSIGLAGFITYHAVKNMKNVILIFAEATQNNVASDIEKWIIYIKGVKEIHHLHIWNIDESKICATVHVITNNPKTNVKKQIRHIFEKYGINHVTIEIETEDEMCNDTMCSLYKEKINKISCCHGHHHSHNYKEKHAVKLQHLDIEI